jgi:predicted small metal-binding protein
MKEFACANLGKKCRTTLTAQTEERLAELAAVHLREDHGMASVTPDVLARIKQLFTNRASEDAASAVDRIFEKYNCNSDPQCTWRYIAEAEMILTGSLMAHARELKAA